MKILKGLRKKFGFKSIFAYLILGTIILVFVFLGVDPTSIGSRRGGVMAIVNKKSISMLDYQRALEGLRTQFQKSSKEDLSKEQEKRLKMQAINHLIQLELIQSESKNSHFFISEKEIADTLIRIPYFQSKNVFRKENYFNFLRFSQQSASEFETEIGKQLLYQKFLDYFRKSLNFTQLEKDKKNQADQVRINLDFFSFEISKLKDQGSYEDLKQDLISENKEKIENFFKENQLTLQNTGEFSLNVSEIPKIVGSENLLRNLLQEKLEEKKYLNKPISFLNRTYIFKVKSLNHNKNESAFLFSELQYFFQMSLVESVFLEWIQSLKEKASIKYYVRIQE